MVIIVRIIIMIMWQYTLTSYLFQTQRRKLPWQGQTLTSFWPPSGKEMILYPFFVFLYSSESNTIVRLLEILVLRISLNYNGNILKRNFSNLKDLF